MPTAPGIQELLALGIVALVVGAVVFRRIRARRRRRTPEASISPDDIRRRK